MPTYKPETVLQQIREEWLAARQATGDDDGSRGDTAFRNLDADREADILGRYGLGLGARLRLIWAYTGQGQLLAELKERNVTADALKLAVENEGGRVRMSTLRRFAEALPETWRKVKPEALEQEYFDAPTAPDDFLHWLRDAANQPATNLSLLPSTPQTIFYKTPDREDLVREILTFLRCESPGGSERVGRKLIQVVQGEGLTAGLRALARHLCDRLEDDQELAAGRPICFLPVSRYFDETNQNISFAKLVASLRAFCRREPVRTDNTLDARAIQDAIREIAETMRQTPFILILDGWSSPSGPFSRLNSLIVDDGLVELLSQLVQPQLGDDAGLVDLDPFYDNRVLVLAETPMPSLGAYQYKRRPLILGPPSEDAMAEIIKNQGRRNAAVLVQAARSSTMRADAALSVLEDLSTRGPAAVREDRYKGTRALDFLVEDWLAWLQAEHPAELLILRFIALARDGVRIATLRLMLEKWEKIVAGENLPDHWRVPPELTQFHRLLEALQGIASTRSIILGLDEPITGLDDFHYPYVHLYADDLNKARLTPEEALKFADIPAASLRRRIVTDLLERPEDARLVARMHRLICEEAVAQYTIIARHGDWNETFNVRHYRRLVQSIFHGFASLACYGHEDGAEQDIGLQNIRRTLPSFHQATYDRLFSIFYRGLMDMPPNWEISRMMGREDIKEDLLLLSIISARRHDERPLLALYDLSDDEDLIPTRLVDDAHWTPRPPVAIAQLVGLASAAYHNNDIKRAKSAVKACRALLDAPEAGQPWPQETFRAWIDLAKIDCDIEIVSATADALADTVREEILEYLARAGFREELSRLDAALAATTMRSSSAGWIYEDAIDAFVKGLASGEASSSDVRRRPVPPRQLVAWSDLLSRLAECLALSAIKFQDDAVDIGEDFLQAFQYLMVGERLRRLAFEQEPLERHFYINGHSTRVLVRVVLKLIKTLDKTTDEKLKQRLPSRAYLELEARRHLDILGRYLSKFETERASLLLMEAIFARIIDPDRKRGLETAEKLLARAGDSLASTVNRPRVHLRFTLERCKVLTALSALPIDDQDESEIIRRRNLSRAAIHEAHRLADLADLAGLPLWNREATNRRRWTLVKCRPYADQAPPEVKTLSRRPSARRRKRP